MGQEEKEDGLVGILSDVLEDEEAIKETLAQILERWNKETTIIDDELKKATVDVSKLDLVGKMNEITQQKIATYTPKEHKEQTEDQRRIKEAILQGYAEGSEGSDEEDEEGGDGGGGGSLGGLAANTNAASCHAEQVEIREKQKAASAAKKEKDKLDRENQKKAQEDRKKKAQAKAAKGERKA